MTQSRVSRYNMYALRCRDAVYCIGVGKVLFCEEKGGLVGFRQEGKGVHPVSSLDVP